MGKKQSKEKPRSFKAVRYDEYQRNKDERIKKRVAVHEPERHPELEKHNDDALRQLRNVGGRKEKM